jgi:hypothetical protein
MANSKLDEVYLNDPFGLLNTSNDNGHSSSGSLDVLVNSFEEICEFYEETGREPDDRSIIEFMLKARLDAIRRNPDKVKYLKKYDFHGLLNTEESKEIGLNDILNNDSLGILVEEDDDITNLKYVKPNERIRPDYLSRRRVCIDFELYANMFAVVHKDIAGGRRRLLQFKEESLRPGRFFALNGILFFLEDINASIDKKKFKTGDRERLDGRTRCIFDNGTESDMLYRSLIKAMMLDGFEISDPIIQAKGNIETADDKFNGYIYILKTKSKDQQVLSIPDLYKIGYTTSSVTIRIKNAKKQPTFLFADVEVVATYRILNISSSNIESLIHTFFREAKVNIEVYGHDDTKYNPEEWFSVPFDAISQVMELVNSQELMGFYYDVNYKKIIKK